MGRTILAALGVAAASVCGAAEGAPAPAASFETEAFFVRWSGQEESPSDVSGIDLRWTVGARRWSFRTAVAAMHSTGPAGVVLFGSTIVGVRGRPAPEDDLGGGVPTGTSSGTGSGEGTASANGGNMPTVFDPVLASVDRDEFGLGDVRLHAAFQLGNDSPAGRFYARAGAKAPTADETRGLGTGEWDGWAGFGWRRDGWTTDVEAQLEWVRLGDPEGYVLNDGVAGSLFLSWPIGRGGLRAGVDTIDAGLPEDSTRARVIAGCYRAMGPTASWNFEAFAGLTEDSPDFGVGLALRY